ncbi:hypothetical protein OESDEN_07529 [Oesophagostomum dentatum]|uniref:Uncharacterized protein n=1 Tax=Oesophagostomum dentatum TaxID=61180 RepID=A0A0B1T4T9_OESDE|nr:hypothetical protein OESDEN_07529 [Oesophagostomum dentatum]
MEPKVVAATVNAIVEGGWRGEEARPPYPGITLLNMDKRPLGKCPSEKVLQIPSRSESALTLGDKRSTTGSGSTPTGMGTPENKISPVPVRRATTAHGYVLASLINNLSESDSRTNMGMKTDLSSDILGKRRSSDEVDVNIPCNKKTNQKRKRKRRSSKTVEAAGTSSTTSTNKNQIAKVTTSEINVWEPNGSIRNRIASKESTKPSKESIRLAPPIQQPSLNVYELWKQAQGRKLGKILQETEKPPVTDQSRAQKAAVKAADK